jgi:hypothetical protein
MTEQTNDKDILLFGIGEWCTGLAGLDKKREDIFQESPVVVYIFGRPSANDCRMSSKCLKKQQNQIQWPINRMLKRTVLRSSAGSFNPQRQSLGSQILNLQQARYHAMRFSLAAS